VYFSFQPTKRLRSVCDSPGDFLKNRPTCSPTTFVKKHKKLFDVKKVTQKFGQQKTAQIKQSAITPK
jgi:hypothetical protein